MARFSLEKVVDEAAPLLAELVVSGKPLRMHVEFVHVDEQGKESAGLPFDLPDVLLAGSNP